MEETKQSWKIDTDCGVDDAQAIIIGATFLNIAAITTVAGNTSADKSALNVARVLEACKREVPIIRGANRPMVNSLPKEQNKHGLDGLGDHPDIQTMSGYKHCIVEKERAADAIIRLINDSPGRVNVLLIGPMTNMAIALTLAPSIAEKVGRVVAMGGTKNGRGKIDFNKETNFAFDPEAAYICVEQLRQIELLPWETV